MNVNKAISLFQYDQINNLKQKTINSYKYLLSKFETIYAERAIKSINADEILHEKFLSGSGTYKESLDVIKIGLALDDATKLGKDKDEYAEVVKYKKSYKNAIDSLNLSKDEKQFFIVDENDNIYRRAELNTLTSPELISFIERKIKHRPITPSVEQLRDYISMDKTEIIKNALFKVYASNMPDISIDKEEIANRIQKAINNKKHWTLVLDDVLEKYTEEKAEEVQKLIRKDL